MYECPWMNMDLINRLVIPPIEISRILPVIGLLELV
jgi:hypothetical protein